LIRETYSLLYSSEGNTMSSLGVAFSRSRNQVTFWLCSGCILPRSNSGASSLRVSTLWSRDLWTLVPQYLKRSTVSICIHRHEVHLRIPLHSTLKLRQFHQSAIYLVQTNAIEKKLPIGVWYHYTRSSNYHQGPRQPPPHYHSPKHSVILCPFIE